MQKESGRQDIASWFKWTRQAKRQFIRSFGVSVYCIHIRTSAKPQFLFQEILERKNYFDIPDDIQRRFSPNVFANYACSGTVGYLGIEGNGNVVVALDNSTRIHKICSLDSQGSYSMVISACKAAYGALLVAKTSGKSIKIYYYDNGYTCGSIPEWNIIHETYFVEGPY